MINMPKMKKVKVLNHNAFSKQTLLIRGKYERFAKILEAFYQLQKIGWNDLISNRTYSAIAFSKQELIKMV